MVPLKNILVFVMAGGKGERLYPLTKHRAKPAVPFAGIYRIIDFTLSNCVNSDLRKIHVLTQYKSISLERHLRLGWNIFHGELGEYIDVVPAQKRVGETWYLGTADSIYQNIYSIEKDKPLYVVILAGDHVYKMNYAEMVQYHIDKKADATVSVVEVSREKATQFGVLAVDSDYRVKAFEEKPAEPRAIPGHPGLCLASMGIYVFSTEVLEQELTEDAQKETDHDFGRNIIPGMIGRRSVFAYDFKDENRKQAKYWRDIGSLDAYWEANMDCAAVAPEFNLYDSSWPIRTHHEQYPPAKTVFAQEYAGGRLGTALDSLISDGCIISGGRVQNSVLSPNVRVNSYAEVYDSVIMEGVNIGRHAKIRRAIIDKDVTIPSGTSIGYSPEEDSKRFTVTPSGIVVVEKGMEVEPAILGTHPNFP